ncbi:MAG: 2OG-Fe(II) oxygenase [Oscillatoriaceae bacterium SKW80]|nr:2OG-Fe(II) oxygenase [Oscillatoriaceae bacterium SKYG93]MCX8122408.1 2OG-Fe(II) oxygenase [Oscillatoriaceae bacterium SKW80]MDW8452667.1 2OG-Fe(II) oxygenase [Oscillatoriaceae cyanobacterium SKYGB_i_bin93]HIK28008.1 2OG-Fe(II) oxygenase [Oscillatoriaceae cyanobacterium M7585_C2015_266]
MQSEHQQFNSYDVKVTLLLEGGHQYPLWLKSDSPILENLLKVVVAHSQNQSTNILFQLPINEGHAALYFSSKQLIGVITEPPIFVQQGKEQQAAVNSESKTPQKSYFQPAQPVVTNVLPSEYLQLDNFLSPNEQKRLIEFVIQKEKEFVPTSTSTGAADYRRSWVLYSFPEFSELLISKIRAIFPDICRKLGLQPFKISQIEAQITAHNDGNYYKVHNDNGSADTATRTITYVYYFYREPKAYSGGELVIYDSKIENNFYVKADSFKTIEPRNNSIVFFLSRYMHEVLPVSCPSKAFADSRFTINGWVRR